MSALYHVEQLLLFPHKKCTSCHIEKPLEEFYKQSPKRGGYQAWCIDCWKEKRQQRHLQNIQSLANRERPISRVCIRCHIEKPIDKFYVDTNSKSGYKSACKICQDKAFGYKHIGKTRDRRGIPVTPGYKWCYGCESEQPHSNFLKDETKWDGYHTKCNDCRKAQRHVFWQENRERLLLEKRIQFRLLFNANPEPYRAYQRKKSKEPRYRLIGMAMQSRRQARKFATTVEEVDFRRIIQRDGYHCYICEQSIDPTIKVGPARLSFDHVIPLAKDGTHTADNIKPTHLVCNQRKNRRPFSEMDAFQRRGPDC